MVIEVRDALPSACAKIRVRRARIRRVYGVGIFCVVGLFVIMVVRFIYVWLAVNCTTVRVSRKGFGVGGRKS